MVSIRVFGANRQKVIPVTKEIRALVKRCCVETLYEEGYTGNFEVSVTFVDNEAIRDINREYRDIDSATDVLSFPASEKDEEFEIDPETDCAILGDIVISLEKALEQADEYGHSFRREVAFLTVHSMLHLLGYDHVTSAEDEAVMLGKQEIVLDAMGIERI